MGQDCGTHSPCCLTRNKLETRNKAHDPDMAESLRRKPQAQNGSLRGKDQVIMPDMPDGCPAGDDAERRGMGI